MSDKKKQAQLAFKAICKALDDNNWRYDKDIDKMSIVCGARGDDLPIPLRITVDGDRALLRMSSYVNSVPESKRMEAAAVICSINYRLVSGCFDYDIRDGETEGFVNLPLGIRKVRMSFLLKEEDDRFRVSVRSKKGISANRCAAEFFNGGGHEQAAGGKLIKGRDLSAEPDIAEVAEYVEKCTYRFFNEKI